jgi:hypothetical protein
MRRRTRPLACISLERCYRDLLRGCHILSMHMVERDAKKPLAASVHSAAYQCALCAF